jgi:FkbM family methyltransferase
MKNYYNNIIKKTIIRPKTILEIGSRDGNDASNLMKYFQLNDKDVWVVEPNPNQIKIIESSYPNFNLISDAIFNEETEHDFYQVISTNPNDVGTSSLINRNDDWYESKTNVIKVKTITGKKLLDIINRDIDICKIDVEGLTIEVLSSFGKDLNKIKSLHLECEHSEVWKGQKLYDDVSKFLIEYNYVQIYFEYCSGGTLQSDSIWVLKNYLNEV